MCMPLTKLDLHPMDIHNICLYLRRHKEILGPRSLRFILNPGKPVKIIFDPWNHELVCDRSVYYGDDDKEIRIWGRRRLHILERLIPVAKKFSIYLMGTGLPSFYVADLGDMAFTLGLSGWSANDWSKAGNFDLMTARSNVDMTTKKHVFNTLKRDWFNTPDELVKKTKFDMNTVLSSMSAYAQAGSAIYDLNKQVYRVRELSNEPLPMDKLRFSNEREEAAVKLLEQNAVKLTKKDFTGDKILNLQGQVKSNNKILNPKLTIDSDERIVKGECDCRFFYQNKMYKGPCEHMISLRLLYNRMRIR